MTALLVHRPDLWLLAVAGFYGLCFAVLYLVRVQVRREKVRLLNEGPTSAEFCGGKVSWLLDSLCTIGRFVYCMDHGLVIIWRCLSRLPQLAGRSVCRFDGLALAGIWALPSVGLSRLHRVLRYLLRTVKQQEETDDRSHTL